MTAPRIKDVYFLFDLDGTLADTLADIAASVNAMLCGMGLPEKTDSEIRESIGSGIHQVVIKLTAIRDKSEVERAVSLFRDHYEAHLLDKTRLYDGVEQFTGSPDFSGSVISNKPDIFVKKILAGLGVSDRFDACIGGLGGFPHKPDPAAASYILQRFCDGRTPFLVGDSPIDRETAENSGVRFLFARYGYSSEAEKTSLSSCPSLGSFGDLFRLFSA